MNQISDYLYVGGIQSSEYNWHNFGVIVNCSKYIPFQRPIYHHHVSKQIRIPVNDHLGECDRFLVLMKKTKVLNIIHQSIVQGISVLVHCHAGSQRSCALIACYLMKYHYMKLDEAMDRVRKQRSIAFYGGANFLHAMQQFYLNLRATGHYQVEILDTTQH
jgi:hypothetical protein